MGCFMIYLLVLQQLQFIAQGAVTNHQRMGLNTLKQQLNDINHNVLATAYGEESTSPNNKEFLKGPEVSSSKEQPDFELPQPITALDIDFVRNMIILKLNKQDPNKKRLHDGEVEHRKLLDTDFMRFARSNSDFMRFGKRQLEQTPPNTAELSSIKNIEDSAASVGRYERSRDARGDNFMRFGRNPQDFMRFGRSPQDFMRFGRSPQDFMRFGRASPTDNNFMRFGRSMDFMRFGRSLADLMGFGDRAVASRDYNFYRQGRPDNFMRFGRNSKDGNSDKSDNFMRFGKDLNHQIDAINNKSTSQQSFAKTMRTKNKLEDSQNALDKDMKNLLDRHDDNYETSHPNGGEYDNVSSSEEYYDSNMKN